MTVRAWRLNLPWLLLIMAAAVGPAAEAPGHGPPTAEPTPSTTAEAAPPKEDDAEPGPDIEIELSPAVAAMLADERLDSAYRRRLQIFHGQWDKVTDPTPAEAGAIALARFDLMSPTLALPDVPALIRAKAAWYRGEMAAVLELLADDDSPPARLLRAEALDTLGRRDDAISRLEPLREAAHRGEYHSAEDLVAAGRGMALLAELQGRPAQDYRRSMALFAQARDEANRFYWPAYLAEAALLLSKDNPAEAAAALTQAMTLNPRSGEAWRIGGMLTLDRFDFQRSTLAVQKLREIHPEHLLADVVEAHMLLQQKSPTLAAPLLAAARARYPKQPELHALAIAAATLIDTGEGDSVLALPIWEAFDAMHPGSALAYHISGMYLSLARQYDRGAIMLRKAIERRPNWPAPHVELGLLLMQAGLEAEAATQLRMASQLDPFNLRAANQAQLAADMLSYEVIETEHFTIKYKAGVDRTLARDMPEQLEAIYRDITRTYQHEPRNRTLIEIMPDEEAFGVRITGMPDIWTVAAATGDVIAMTPPRVGAKMRGTYDWVRVLRHEFVHTVTLDMTRNRIPHWFTEACAVSQEPGGRDYETAVLLAGALQQDRLFELAEINWGFVRPRTPIDRPLAYAQAHWMYEFITLRFGHRAILQMLRHYRDGATDVEGLEKATGIDAETFMSQFRSWAREQVQRWGLLRPSRTDPALQAALAGTTRDADRVAELLETYPDQPDLLRLAAGAAMQRDDLAAAERLVSRYAMRRPVDPWSDRILLAIALKQGRSQEAIGYLETLDIRETTSGALAAQLADLYRQAGDLSAAAASIARALHREPYNPRYREVAATIALQQGQWPLALRYVEDLAMLEPKQAAHQVRRAALLAQLERPDEAADAARAARELDPKAPVGRFLPDEP